MVSYLLTSFWGMLQSRQGPLKSERSHCVTNTRLYKAPFEECLLLPELRRWEPWSCEASHFRGLCWGCAKQLAAAREELPSCTNSQHGLLELRIKLLATDLIFPWVLSAPLKFTSVNVQTLYLLLRRKEPYQKVSLQRNIGSTAKNFVFLFSLQLQGEKSRSFCSIILYRCVV